MKIADVLANAESLLGQTVEVEGFCLHIAFPESRWYLCGEISETPDFSQVLPLLVPEEFTRREIDEDRFFDDFIQTAEQHNITFLDRTNLKAQMDQLIYGRDEDWVSPFFEKRLEEVLWDLKALPQQREWGFPTLSVDLRAYYLESRFYKAGLRYLRYCTVIGQVVPVMDHSPSIGLAGIRQVRIETEDFTAYVLSELPQLDKVDLEINTITYARDITENPADYVGRRLRVKGYFMGFKFAWEKDPETQKSRRIRKTQFWLLPNEAYVLFRSQRIPQNIITIHHDALEAKLLKISQGFLGPDIDYDVIGDIHLIGTVEYADDSDVRLKLVNITHAVSTDNHTLFYWKI